MKLAWLVLAVAVAACSTDSTESPPTVPARLEIVSGNNVTDTISVANLQGLVVRVTGTDGKPANGVVVNFESASQACRDIPAAQCSVVLLAPADISAGFKAAASAITGADGTAVVRTRMGQLSGNGTVNITVPAFGLATQANFTVNPGAAVAATAAPRDTSVVAASSYQVRNVALVDRAGNPVSGSVTYQASSASISVNATGRVTALTPGRAYVIILASGRRVDSVAVTVKTGDAAPTAARIAVSNIHGPITLTTLDGSATRVLLTGLVSAQDWSPAGDRLVYVDDRGAGEYALSITDTLGNHAQLTVPLRSTWPQYSYDGQWIYFFTQTSDPPRVMRIRPSNTGIQELMVGGRFPSPSPDGVRVAMSLDAGGIWVGNPVTKVGAVLPNTTSGIAVRWSPDGQWIAYRANSAVVIIRPDGTGKRTFTSTFIGGIAWSPDSRYVLSGGDEGAGAQLQLIDIVDNTVTKLPVLGVYPAWKPVP